MWEGPLTNYLLVKALDYKRKQETIDCLTKYFGEEAKTPIE